MTIVANLAHLWVATTIACFLWISVLVLIGQRRDRDAAGFDVAVDEACALTDVESDFERWEAEVGT